MKTWQKRISLTLAVFLIAVFTFFLTRNHKECCLCNSFRYHAPCLIDLKTGDIIELDLYFPHPTLVAELADPQPEMGTFSYVRLGSATGTKLTDSKIIELEVPTETTQNPSLCKECKKQTKSNRYSRYVLADLYDMQNKMLIPIVDGSRLDIRCYEITMIHNKEKGIIDVKIQGFLLQ